MRALFLLLLLSQISCYSFRGISIDPEIDYFFVETFEDVSGAIPPGYNEIFTETFVQKILNDTRLDVSEPKGEIIFSGKFTQFLVRAEDPGENTETNLNRLYLTITVEYYNQKTDESWTKKYEERQDFGGEVNFADVEDELLEIVAERIIERIFIDAFTNW